MKQLLMVAFFFPPYSGGSGVHRASRFARYLPENGWCAHVLTANCRAYERVDSDVWSDGSAGSVTRAFALDAQRHLALCGRYFRWSALPDRWSSWMLGAIPAGLLALYRRQIDLILVTFPIATAVLIGLILHRATGKPLVVDFRDSMTEEEYPRDPKKRAVYRWIEKSVIERGSQFIFTTQLTREMYLKRYPQLPAAACVIIPNGYDEADFADFRGISFNTGRNVLRFIHSGLIYPDDRDPRAFFRALTRLKREGTINSRNLRIDLRASGSEEYYSTLLEEFGIGDLVHLLPALPHQDALRDTAAADGFLLFQAASCNHQIPAKVYEYLRLAKPIFALTPMSSDTAVLLKEVGGATIADLGDEDFIVRAFSMFISSVRQGTHSLPQPHKVQRYTRRNETAELARCLDHLVCSDLTRADL